ncbi:hypothetical protein Cadr_000021883 [Camelus dromedarius]|uniref:Secreted protein n=1 Tax=Camelus dromedarius TaxID=9838 RepID=A0A5N4CT99_CAMDR|nr:hypothetical protein Cadr_000021883 [Camelus dromedarius]
MVCSRGAGTLMLISTAFTSLASVSSPWNEATLFEAPRGLSSMGLAPVHPGDWFQCPEVTRVLGTPSAC